jgi:hypothetical protein
MMGAGARGVVPEWFKLAQWSDHLIFWQFGYPGITVTDTGVLDLLSILQRKTPWGN